MGRPKYQGDNKPINYNGMLNNILVGGTLAFSLVSV